MSFIVVIASPKATPGNITPEIVAALSCWKWFSDSGIVFVSMCANVANVTGVPDPVRT